MNAKQKPLTEFEIQNALCSRIFQDHHHICPNYTPQGWWECDLFAVTRAGFFVEFEIKVTASDFRHDRNKSREFWRDKYSGKITRDGAGGNKHELMASGVKNGPSRFYFVLPENVVPSAEVPEWAGIIRASRFGNRVCVGFERKAPRLHREMVSSHVIHHVSKVFYYRFWNERRKDRGNGATFEALKE